MKTAFLFIKEIHKENEQYRKRLLNDRNEIIKILNAESTVLKGVGGFTIYNEKD